MVSVDRILGKIEFRTFNIGSAVPLRGEVVDFDRAGLGHLNRLYKTELPAAWRDQLGFLTSVCLLKPGDQGRVDLLDWIDRTLNRSDALSGCEPGDAKLKLMEVQFQIEEVLGRRAGLITMDQNKIVSAIDYPGLDNQSSVYTTEFVYLVNGFLHNLRERIEYLARQEGPPRIPDLNLLPGNFSHIRKYLPGGIYDQF